MWFAYAIIWISVACTTCFGLYVTKEAWCLWALVLPLFIKFSCEGNDDKSLNDKEDSIE